MLHFLRETISAALFQSFTAQMHLLDEPQKIRNFDKDVVWYADVVKSNYSISN
jgi:hypothetical protein